MNQLGKRDLYAPGLKRMKRHNGRIDLYWVADEKAVRQGYPTKTVRLFGDWNDPISAAQIAARCSVLQQEMLEWLSGHDVPANPHPHGTIAWLCSLFETDPNSPYKALRHDTQKFYSRYIKTILETVGSRRLSAINGRDVRRWFTNWEERHGHRSAYGCIQTLRRIVNYGVELRDVNCIELSTVLTKTEFKTPRRRKSRPTHELIVAFCEAARDAGRHSIALAVTLQFELGLRQKDVIGEWVPANEDNQLGVFDGNKRWQWGLTWDQIDSLMILYKPTSKSNGEAIAEHDLKLHPEIIAALADIPKSKRIGPVIIDEHSGKPWHRAHFSRQFRKIARSAGWPDDVWNMDSRAGAISESFEAGAAVPDVMKAATHTQVATTMGYNRGAIVQTSRVTELRLARRNSSKNTYGNKHGNNS